MRMFLIVIGLASLTIGNCIGMNLRNVLFLVISVSVITVCYYVLLWSVHEEAAFSGQCKSESEKRAIAS